MNSISVQYGTGRNLAENNISIPIRNISVGSSNSDLIKYDDFVIGTLTRAYAKKYGKLIIFSFVISNTSSIPSSTDFFTIDSSIAPKSQVDFIAANYSTSDSETKVIRCTLTSTGAMYAFDTQKAGNTRGEVIWLVE